MQQRHIRTTGILLSTFFFFVITTPVYAQVARAIAFPVDGANYYRNDFHEPRGGGTRLHVGNDIIAAKMTPVVSTVDGYVTYVASPEPSWGYEVNIQDSEGYSYHYLHLNNDTPGTDDGMGGEANAYAQGIVRGMRVSRGQHLGWVGDSGNAETTVPHLHFEIHDPYHVQLNPYSSLIAATGKYNTPTNVSDIRVEHASIETIRAELRYIFTKELFVGSESSEVQQLQLTLRAFGHFKHPSITGYYGPVTEEAVKSYQRAKKLRETGRVEALTRELLNNDLGTYDPNLYKPFYTENETRAVLIQKLLQQIALLQTRLQAIQGSR
jgi:hypothetical protein